MPLTAHVDDARWVGAMIDLVPYESATNIVHAPELSIAEGQPVEVIVTTGPNKRPLANLAVTFRREHEYSWLENGEKKHGIGSSDSWVTTDEIGSRQIANLARQVACFRLYASLAGRGNRRRGGRPADDHQAAPRG